MNQTDVTSELIQVFCAAYREAYDDPSDAAAAESAGFGALTDIGYRGGTAQVISRLLELDLFTARTSTVAEVGNDLNVGRTVDLGPPTSKFFESTEGPIE